MRTKTVLLTTLLGAASIATSVAQTVYSVNAVGYVNVPVKAGAFALLANPLNQPTNSILAVLPDVPTGTIIYVYNLTSQQFDTATKRSATSWSGTAASATLNPGQGFFIKNAAATDMTITFVGEVPQGTLTVTYPAGFSLVGSIVPQAGGLEKDLGYPAQSTDMVYKYNGTGYDIYTRRSTGSWTGVTGQTDVPLTVAEGVWLKASAAGTWTRSFSVNN